MKYDRYMKNINTYFFVLGVFLSNALYASECPGYVMNFQWSDDATFTGKCTKDYLREWGETTFTKSNHTFYGTYDNSGKRSIGKYTFKNNDTLEAEYFNQLLEKNGYKYDRVGKYTFSESGNAELGYILTSGLNGFGFKTFERDTSFENEREIEAGIYKRDDEGGSYLNGYGVRYFKDDSVWFGYWRNGALFGAGYFDDGSGEYQKYTKNDNDFLGPYKMTSSDLDRLERIKSFVNNGMDDLEEFATRYDTAVEDLEILVSEFNLDSYDTKDEQLAKNSQTSKELISSIQELLAELGYNPGPIDGVLGELTITAIKAFEYELDLEELTGKPSETLLIALQLAVKSNNSIATNKNDVTPDLIGTGTGFYVNNKNIITNYHVIEDCEYQTEDNGQELHVKVSDMVNDLALLEGPENSNYLPISPEPPILGERIYVSGFPLNSGLKSFMITSGNVSSLTGLGKNFSNFSHTAPSQPGNSGGAIINEYGSVVGILVGSIDEDIIKEMAGSSPQNINFGIKNTVLKSMLEDNQIKNETRDSFFRKSQKNIAEMSKDASILIKCYGYSE